MTVDNKPKRSQASRRAAGEAFVLTAITMVAAAVGLGLYLQLGMSLWNAALSALATYAGLICVHVLVRRSQAIRELAYEVNRLEGELMRLSREPEPRLPMPTNADQQLSSLRPASHSGQAAAANASHSHPASRAKSATPPAQGSEPGGHSPSHHWGGAVVARPYAVPAQATPELAGSASRVETQKPPARDAAESMARFWSVRPTEAMAEKPMQSADLPGTAAQPKAQAGWANPEAPAKPAPGQPGGPRQDSGKPIPSDRQPPRAHGGDRKEAITEGDVDAINDMIRMFSEEIASHRRVPPGAPVQQTDTATCGDDAAEEVLRDEAVISASVGALRAAADEMRRPPETGRTAIEKGVLPPFKPDPSSSTPQPPAIRPEHAQAAAMADAIATHKLDVLLEPVVGLADRKARHFEISLRLRLGEAESIGPDDYVPMARWAGLLPTLDATRAARAAIVARHMDERGSGGCLFSSITAESLTSERFLEEFAEACRQSPKLRERLVFSICESELRDLSGAQWSTIRQLAGSGFRFAIHDLTSLDLDLAETRAAGFAFVRVAARALLDGVASVDGVLPAADLCKRLAAAGLTLIVVGLESEEQLDGALAAGIPLGQGRLFGVPRPIRAEALRPARSAAA